MTSTGTSAHLLRLNLTDAILAPALTSSNIVEGASDRESVGSRS